MRRIIPHSRRRRFPAWFLVGAMSGVVAACSDPRFGARQSVRDERIHYYSQSYLRREVETSANRRALEDERKALQTQRDVGLVDRLQDVKRQEQVRVEELRDTRPVRRERVRSIVHGKPETLRDTWADMFY